MRETKVCAKCKEEKSVLDFGDRIRKGVNYYRARCRPCEALDRTHKSMVEKELPPRKTCPMCDVEKPSSEFHLNRYSWDGLSSYCKPCRKRSRNSVLDQAANKRWRQRNPKQIMLLNSASRSRRKGIPFAMTVEDFDIPATCPVLGIPLESASKRHDGSPTIDRIINDLGYVKGNIIVISWRANRIKSDATLDELRAITSFYEGANP